ncbi:RND transporter, partial [Burkholderia pseudomallei]
APAPAAAASGANAIRIQARTPPTAGPSAGAIDGPIDAASATGATSTARPANGRDTTVESNPTHSPS